MRVLSLLVLTKTSLGLAQVEITIDNQDKILPVDYSEVTVSRRFFVRG